MRIAQIAPPIERVPAKKYGGTERVVYHLTEELVKRGHDVTLFATGDSITSAQKKFCLPKSLRELYPDNPQKWVIPSLEHIGYAYSHQDQFDIIHDHTSVFGLSYAQSSRTPVISTIHGVLTKETIAAYQLFNKPYLATISHAQAKPAPDLHYVANVYNGLDMQHYPFSPTHKGYLLFVGRITKDKGVHAAIAIARKTHFPLIIAAKLDECDKPYYEKEVKPYLNKDIQWIGEVTEQERNELMRYALAFLHPISWEEPFGLTLIEAMACGCPVIAINKGSIPEIIKHGTTGFVASTWEEMASYIPQLSRINRAECRMYARTHFSSSRMAQAYEKVYATILKLHYQAPQPLHTYGFS